MTQSTRDPSAEAELPAQQKMQCYKHAPLSNKSAPYSRRITQAKTEAQSTSESSPTALLPLILLRLSPRSFPQLLGGKVTLGSQVGSLHPEASFSEVSGLRTKSIHGKGRSSHPPPRPTQASELTTLQNEFINNNMSIRFHFPKIPLF